MVFIVNILKKDYFCNVDLKDILMTLKKITLFITLFLFCMGCTGPGTQQTEQNKNKQTYASLDDARQARFAVITGNLHDKYITANFPDATPMRYDTYPDITMALDAGNADVACVEGVVYEVSQKKTQKYEVLGTLFDDPYGFGFNKKDAGLCAQFNTFLASVQADGTLKEMEDRWIGQYETAQMPDLGSFPTGKPLRVGCCGATEVFDFISDGHNAGFDIELVTRFAHSIGRPVEFMTINFGGLIAALSSGKVDVICSAITISDERKQKIDFSEPYYISQSIAIVLRDRHAGSLLRDGSDVATSKVAVMTGTTGEMYIREHYPTATIQDFDDVNDAILSLTTGKSDYVATTYTTALMGARKNPELAVLPQKFNKASNGIAISKSNPQLLEQVNNALTILRKDGTLDAVISHWVRTDGSDYPEVDEPEVSTGEPLRVGISANREPVCFIRNGHYTGLDCELIRRIAHQMGRRVEFVDMKFSALIAALESKRVDLLISNITPTEERRKRVNFSDGYFENPDVLLIHKGAAYSEAPVQKSWFSSIKDSFYNNLILEKRYLMVVEGLWQTLLITFFAGILGTLFGGIICAMRMSSRWIFNSFAQTYISVIRGIPVLVLLMILFYVVFASSGLNATLVAILTFSLNMAAYSSEMFRTAILSVDRGQKEAGIALGFTSVQTFIYIILPQAIRMVMPVYKGELISMLKMTSVVGYIAVVDLTKASDIIRSRTFDAFFPLVLVAVIYFLCAWLLGLGLDALNRKVAK